MRPAPQTPGFIWAPTQGRTDPAPERRLLKRIQSRPATTHQTRPWQCSWLPAPLKAGEESLVDSRHQGLSPHSELRPVLRASPELDRPVYPLRQLVLLGNEKAEAQSGYNGASSTSQLEGAGTNLSRAHVPSVPWAAGGVRP